MKQYKSLAIVMTVATLFTLSGCAAPAKTEAEIACDEKSAGTVSIINDMAKNSTEGVSPFPEIDTMWTALLADGIPSSDLENDFEVLAQYYLDFSDCLTPEGQKLIDESKDIEFAKLF